MRFKLKIDRFTNSEILFFFAYTLYLLPQILNLSVYRKYMGQSVRNLIFIALIFLVIRELTFERRAYTKKNIFLLAVFSIVILITWYVGAGYGIQQKDIALMLIFVYAARRIPFSKICNVTLWISAVTLFLVVFSAKVGIIDNFVIPRGERDRECLGFTYALYAPMILYNITALIAYKNRERFSVIKCCVLFAINYWMYTKTMSRLSFYLSTGILLMPYLLKLAPLIRTKIVGIVSACSFAICCIASFGLSIGYSSSVGWMNSLNTLLGGRLRLGQLSLLEYGFSIVGVKGIQWIGHGLDADGNVATGTAAYNYVDSFYIQVLQRYGIIVLAVLLLLLTVSTYLFWKKQDYTMVVILVFLAFHGVIDDLVLKLYYNTFWFAIGITLMRKGQDFADGTYAIESKIKKYGKQSRTRHSLN